MCCFCTAHLGTAHCFYMRCFGSCCRLLSGWHPDYLSCSLYYEFDSLDSSDWFVEVGSLELGCFYPSMPSFAQRSRTLWRCSFVYFYYIFKIWHQFYLQLLRYLSFPNKFPGNSVFGNDQHIIYSIIIEMNSKMAKIKLKKSVGNAAQPQQNLKGQTAGIQDKLESLKAEIAMRKTIKNQEKQTESSSLKTTQKSKTGVSWSGSNTLTNARTSMQKNNNDQVNKFLLGANKQTKRSSQVAQDKSKLQTLFEQLKMEQYAPVIANKYGINQLQNLLQLCEEDIDAWKDIPVGFRIKIRKFIKEHNKNKQSQNADQKNGVSGSDIQSIIQKRKIQRVYEPISDNKLEQEEEDVEEEFYQNEQQAIKNRNKNKEDQQDEDILIQSLNSAFLSNHRKGIMKKDKSSIEDKKMNAQKISAKNHVHWDAEVRQFNKQTSSFRGQKYNTKYPDQNIVQAIQEQKKSIQVDPQYRAGNKPSYCWNCLKRMQNPIPMYDEDSEQKGRTFCGSHCKQIYSTISQISVSNSGAKPQTSKQQQLQIIDLGIL